MHELFTQVLGNRDLSRAGDLFSVADSAIVDDLTKVLTEITGIVSLPGYSSNDNDQSVVEICVTRVTSCVRETGSAERHCGALVALLESCLHHSLQPSNRDEDPPHAKIAADIISSIFLNYGNRGVMEAALPVAVRFLHKGNKELSRNLASYLSLAAIAHATLLSPHIQPILDSIISGNYPLCRVLAQIYEVSPEPLGNHAMALVALLPHCDQQEQLALLHLFTLIAKNKPSLLEASVPQLCEYLTPPSTAMPTMKVLLCLAEQRPSLLAEHVSSVKAAANRNPSIVCLAAQVIAAVGKLSRVRAQEALNFVLEHLPTADRGSQTTLLREATLLCSSYPVLFTDKMLSSVRQSNLNTNNKINNNNAVMNSTKISTSQSNQVNQTSGGVTIVKLGGGTPLATQPVNNTGPSQAQSPSAPHSGGYTRRAKLGDSRSTGRLHTSSNTHRSMTRLNIAGGSVGGLHSMSRLSSSQQINLASAQQTPMSSGSQGALLTSPNALPVNVHHTSNITSNVSTSQTNHSRVNVGTLSGGSSANLTVNHVTPVPPLSNSVVVTGHNKWGIPNTGPTKVHSGGVTVTTIVQPRIPVRPPSALGSSTVILGQTTSNNGVTSGSNLSSAGPTGTVSVSLAQTLGSTTTGVNPVSVSCPVTVTSRRTNNTSVTILNANSANQRMSVFEPYPMRDTVQHFCEKHLDKIRSYMDSVSSRIPPPAKCTIEERRAKKLAKLHFACQARGQHCLYSKTFFTMRTRNPRIWIHLMFIALQARSQNALSSRDSSVSSLKHCWDMIKCENKTFVTLVTSAFPCAKDQETLLNELRHSGFFDVFELGPIPEASSSPLPVMSDTGVPLQWGCFLCNHPERAMGFLRDNTQPVIEGQLKEKKGRWRLFRRWRTRYFTLSGAHLSCKGSSGGESIDINQIRSVKVSRGARNIPKAFEIFTGDQTLILKPKDGKNAEEWVQCLSIVVAHSQARDVPIGTKSNSLPARGLAGSRTAV